jgi:excisionase family DNA binding protein
MLNPDKLYTITEALPFLGVRRTAVYAHINSGRLRAVKLGRATRLLGRDIAVFHENLPGFISTDTRDRTKRGSA